MDKKKIILLIVIILFIILLIPIKDELWDGGSIEYKAILYKVTKVHRINSASPTGYDEGLEIKILGKEIYNNVLVHIKVLEKEDIINKENGLLFTINWMDTTKVPVQLNIYDNNKYKLYTHFKACMPGAVCTSELIYTKSEDGTYEYDALKIIQNSYDADTMQFTNNKLPDYEIYTGKDNHMYITFDSNKYLKEFLNELKINLKESAIADYN